MYKVGYKRPPEHTRFKPGQSGNPRGRPRQKKGFAELLHDRLFRSVSLRENGEKRRMLLAEARPHPQRREGRPQSPPRPA